MCHPCPRTVLLPFSLDRTESRLTGVCSRRRPVAKLRNDEEARAAAAETQALDGRRKNQISLGFTLEGLNEFRGLGTLGRSSEPDRAPSRRRIAFSTAASDLKRLRGLEQRRGVREFLREVGARPTSIVLAVVERVRGGLAHRAALRVIRGLRGLACISFPIGSFDPPSNRALEPSRERPVLSCRRAARLSACR